MTTILEGMQAYLEDLSLHRPGQTAETYGQALRRFEEFLDGAEHPQSLDVSSLTADCAIRFAQWLTERLTANGERLTKASIRVYLSGVLSFFTFLLRMKLIDLSFSNMIEIREAFHQMRHGHRRQTPITSLDNAIVTLIVAARAIKPYQCKPRLELARLENIAILEALSSSGMRVGELVGIRLEDLNDQEHSAHIVSGGAKNRRVFFSSAAWQAIQVYLKERADGAKGRALYQLPVFARHDRGAGKKTLPLTTETVRQIFSRIARDAGIDIVMTPHSLRHAFATKVLEATGDLAVVQDMLGHSSPDTTRIYAKVSSKRMKDVHRTAFQYTGGSNDNTSHGDDSPR